MLQQQLSTALTQLQQLQQESVARHNETALLKAEARAMAAEQHRLLTEAEASRGPLLTA